MYLDGLVHGKPAGQLEIQSFPGPDQNQSGVGEHFKEYFRVGEFISGWYGSGYFLPVYETFFQGFQG